MASEIISALPVLDLLYPPIIDKMSAQILSIMQLYYLALSLSAPPLTRKTETSVLASKSLLCLVPSQLGGLQGKLPLSRFQ